MEDWSCLDLVCSASACRVVVTTHQVLQILGHLRLVLRWALLACLRGFDPLHISVCACLLFDGCWWLDAWDVCGCSLLREMVVNEPCGICNIDGQYLDLAFTTRCENRPRRKLCSCIGIWCSCLRHLGFTRASQHSDGYFDALLEYSTGFALVECPGYPAQELALSEIIWIRKEHECWIQFVMSLSLALFTIQRISSYEGRKQHSLKSLCPS